MFTCVDRRNFKPWVYVVVAAQLFLTLPATSSSLGAAVSAAAAPCDQMASASNDDCPCCPDGVQSMRDCLVTCTMAAAATPPAIPDASAPRPRQQVPALEFRLKFAASDPPLKPPPIV
jgi:hypothetical protein